MKKMSRKIDRESKNVKFMKQYKWQGIQTSVTFEIFQKNKDEGKLSWRWYLKNVKLLIDTIR